MAKQTLLQQKVSIVVELASKEIATQWDASIQTNFQRGGRPPWAKTLRGGSPLLKTGRLARSIVVRAKRINNTSWQVTAKTKLAYARIHQFGGVIKPKKGKYLAVPLTKQAEKIGPREWPEGTLFPLVRKGRNIVLCEKRGKTNPKIIAQYVLLRQVVIKKREYIKVTTDDEKIFRAITEYHFGKVFKL